MGKIVNFLSGMQTLEVMESPINGKIKVVKSLAFGTYIQVDGLTQSGGVIVTVWKETLKKVKSQRPTVNSCLILGLGGGSAAGLVRKYWHDAKITGVELDPVMVRLGKEYFDLGGLDINIENEDAFVFCKKAVKKKKKYDLILNDVYVGHEIPEKLESEEYVKLVKKTLAKEGIAIFNRLYYGHKRSQAVKFSHRLEKIFTKVDAFYPEANVMYICSS